MDFREGKKHLCVFYRCKRGELYHQQARICFISGSKVLFHQCRSLAVVCPFTILFIIADFLRNSVYSCQIGRRAHENEYKLRLIKGFAQARPRSCFSFTLPFQAFSPRLQVCDTNFQLLCKSRHPTVQADTTRCRKNKHAFRLRMIFQKAPVLLAIAGAQQGFLLIVGELILISMKGLLTFD